MDKVVEIKAMKWLLEKLEFWELSGRFIWNSGPRMGEVAGTTRTDGYRCFKYPLGERNKSICIFEHRLVWYFFYKRLPRGRIDHIDGDRKNNFPFNLREATARQNAINTALHRSGHLPNTTKVGNKWKSQATFRGKCFHFGYFKTQKEAHHAAKRGLNHLIVLAY